MFVANIFPHPDPLPGEGIYFLRGAKTLPLSNFKLIQKLLVDEFEKRFQFWPQLYGYYLFGLDPDFSEQLSGYRIYLLVTSFSPCY
jgi:hypothetical protein